jgi:predicted O-linked N-acetylglucosamine transferase (SPINDLY family)
MAPPSTLAADHLSPQALQPFGATMPLASPTLAISPMRPIAATEPAAAEPLFKFRLGNLLLAQGAVEEAATAFREVLALRPDLAEAHNNLGIALSKSGDPAAAAFHYLRAIEIAPKLDEAHNNLGCMLMLLGQLRAAISHYRQAIALNPAAPFSYTNLVLALHYLPGVSNALIADTTRRWTAAIPRDRMTPPGRKATEPTRRLRLGYVSGDFRAHPVAYFIESVLAAHDRRSVEVFCYGNAAQQDATTRRIAAIADHWCDVSGLSDDEAAQRIAADAIDILVDLSGHTAGNRLTLFARKPAPIQCTWLGYVGTTGLAEIDYILTDRFVLPPEDERFYSERPYRLPNSYLCFTPPETAIKVGKLPALATGAVTFGCFNNLMKINGPVVDLWSSLLAAVPQSRLYLKTAQLGDRTICAGLEEEFAARGIARERLVLAGLSPRQELLATYNEIDIALDPFPFGGGTTTIEALWMGVPVVSLRGDRFVGRVGESILTAVGLPNLVAASPAEYLATAIALATDLPRLTAFRKSLRRRLVASPLCDAKSFARDLESGYRAMWQAWRRSRKQAA